MSILNYESKIIELSYIMTKGNNNVMKALEVLCCQRMASDNITTRGVGVENTLV